MEQEIERLKAIIAERDAELDMLKQKSKCDVRASCSGVVSVVYVMHTAVIVLSLTNQRNLLLLQKSVTAAGYTN